MTDRELMQQALEAFEWNYNTDLDNIPACEQWAKMLKENITALRAALAEPEQDMARQKPVAWTDGRGFIASHADSFPRGTTVSPLYTHQPTPRKPLTGEEIKQAVLDDPIFGAALMSLMRDEVMVAQLRQAVSGIARAIERAHGIGEQT